MLPAYTKYAITDNTEHKDQLCCTKDIEEQNRRYPASLVKSLSVPTYCAWQVIAKPETKDDTAMQAQCATIKL